MSEIVHCALGYVTNHRRRQRPTNNPNKKLRSATYMAGSFCGTGSTYLYVILEMILFFGNQYL